MSIKVDAPVEPIDHDTGKSRQQAGYDRARRAIRHFYRIKPNLDAFARVFTKNPKMRIEPTSGASATDGKGTIWLKVNIELGDEYKHDRTECGNRDARLQLKCPACLARENILVALFHEIAHNVYESFEAMSDVDKEDAVKQALAEAERFGVSGRRLDAVRKAMTERPPETYGEAAGRISPYLFPLINGLEDARINALTMRARKGMRPMFEARTRRIFEDGIELDSGEFIHWRDQPGNTQIAVAMSCYASGFYESSWFSDDVAEAMADSELRRLVKAAVQTDAASEVYRYGFPILEKLRSLGFCRTPEDEPEEGRGEPDDEDTGGDHDESDDGDGEGRSDEPSDDTEHEPDADASGSGAGSEPGSDDTDDEPQSARQSDDDDEPDPEPDDEPSDPDTGSQSASDDDEPDADASGSDNEDELDADGDPEASDGQGGGADKVDGVDTGEEQEVEDTSDDSGGGGSGGGEAPPQDGTPEEVEQALSALCTHGEASDEQQEDKDIDIAIMQDRDFDEPSSNVASCRILKHGETAPDGSTAFNPGAMRGPYGEHWRLEQMPEQVIQQSLGAMRVAFSENRKGSKQRNLKSGKVNGKVLGRRVPVDDVRLFQKRTRPGKRDYFVVLGLDVSGSTMSGKIKDIKSAAYAQAELLNRIGVDFEIWAHTATVTEAPAGLRRRGDFISCDLYVIKSVDERWTDATRQRLEELAPVAGNLDGHTMEFYRKRLDSSSATEKILMYYTDGAMPAENGREEKVILERELRECKRRGYEVVGVGVGTNSPKQYGMDTVLINSVEDVPEVVRELRRRLT